MPINNTPKEFPKPSAGNLVNQTKLLPCASRMAAPWQPKSEAETIGGERFVLRLPLIEESSEAWERRAQREQAVLDADQESCGHVPGQIAVARLDMIYAGRFRGQNRR